jgi:hypothetical protein
VEFWWDPLWDPLLDPSDQSGISTTCDGPHVTRDTHVGRSVRGCPRGWLGFWVRCLALGLACPSTPDFAGIFVAIIAVAWKNVLVHFWRSRQLLNVLQHTPAMKHWS